MTDIAPPAAPGAGAAPSAGTPPAGAPAPAAPAANGGAPNGAAPNGGASETPWYAATFADPAVRQAIHTGGFKSPDEFGKAYVETKALVGRKGVILPGDNATDDDWAKVYDSLGRPKSADEYKIALPAADYKQTDHDKAYEKTMRPAFHRAGLTQRQIDLLAGAHNGAFGEMKKAMDGMVAADVAKGEAAIGELRTGWGAKADANVALAQRTAQSLIPNDSELYPQLDKLLGAAPFVDLMYRIGTQFSEGGGVLKAGGATGGALSAEQAKVEIEKINSAARADKEHAYMNTQHPEHKAVHKRMQELMAIAYPGDLKLG